MAAMEKGMTEQQMIDYIRRHDLSDLIRSGAPAELAPPEEREVLAVRTVRLSPAIYDQLLRIAQGRGIGASVLMRQIIEQWVGAQNGTAAAEAVVPVAELVEFLNRAARPAA
jgi:predicted transcriptional regulator